MDRDRHFLSQNSSVPSGTVKAEIGHTTTTPQPAEGLQPQGTGAAAASAGRRASPLKQRFSPVFWPSALPLDIGRWQLQAGPALSQEKL